MVALILIINNFVDIQPVLSKFCDNSENVLNIKKNSTQCLIGVSAVSMATTFLKTILHISIYFCLPLPYVYVSNTFPLKLVVHKVF